MELNFDNGFDTKSTKRLHEYGFLPRLLSGAYNEDAPLVHRGVPRSLRLHIADSVPPKEWIEPIVESTVVTDEREFLKTILGLAKPTKLSVNWSMDSLHKLGSSVPDSHGGNFLFAPDVWRDVQENCDDYLDPNYRYEELVDGNLCMLIGRRVLGDHYRIPEHKILGLGEAWAFHKELGGFKIVETPVVANRGPDYVEYNWTRALHFSVDRLDGFAFAEMKS